LGSIIEQGVLLQKILKIKKFVTSNKAAAILFVAISTFGGNLIADQTDIEQKVELSSTLMDSTVVDSLIMVTGLKLDTVSTQLTDTVSHTGNTTALNDVIGKPIYGMATWYGQAHQGRKTANGERFDMNGLTAAHRTLPLGTKIKVTYIKTGKSVVVRVTDRGPAAWTGKEIDLSMGAASKIGLKSAGVGKVKIERIRVN